jgi:hypothetical protein
MKWNKEFFNRKYQEWINYQIVRWYFNHKEGKIDLNGISQWN